MSLKMSVVYRGVKLVERLFTAVQFPECTGMCCECLNNYKVTLVLLKLTYVCGHFRTVKCCYGRSATQKIYMYMYHCVLALNFTPII